MHEARRRCKLGPFFAFSTGMNRFIGSARNSLPELFGTGFCVDSNPAMTDRAAEFSGIVETMKSRYAVRVKRWRKQMSGCAWSVAHPNGRQVNWIEAPHPRTPISLAIFLHEVGHHAIGFSRYKKRCEEEYHVWVWAIEQMRRLGVEPDEKVTRRFELSMQYAVSPADDRMPAPKVQSDMPTSTQPRKITELTQPPRRSTIRVATRASPIRPFRISTKLTASHSE